MAKRRIATDELKLRGTDDYRETMKDIIRTKKPAGSCPAGY